MALGILFIIFAGTALVSAIAAFLMFMVKSEKNQKAVFVFAVIWSLVLAFLNADSMPVNYTGMRFISWAIGAVAVAAAVICVCTKSSRGFAAAKITVTASMAGSIILMFA